MMPLKIATLTLSMGVLLSACGSSFSTSSAKSVDEINRAEAEQLKASPGLADPSQIVKINSYTLIKENLNATEVAAFQTLGCKAPGSFDSTYEVDPALQVGQRFFDEGVFGSIGDHQDLSLSKTMSWIMELSPRAIKLGQNFLSLNLGSNLIDGDRLFVSKPHNTIMISIEKQNQGEKPKVTSIEQLADLTAEGRQLVADAKWIYSSNSYWSCNFDSDKKITQTSKFDKIAYVSSVDGKSVTALLKVIKSQGQIVCEKIQRSQESSKEQTVLNTVPMGEGSSLYTTVVSNEVMKAPNQNDAFISCGGTNLYNSIVTTLNSGTIVTVFASKTDGPIR